MSRDQIRNKDFARETREKDAKIREEGIHHGLPSEAPASTKLEEKVGADMLPASIGPPVRRVHAVQTDQLPVAANPIRDWVWYACPDFFFS